MSKIRLSFLALALIAAGALLASGCKQAGGSADKPDGNTTTPGGTQDGNKDKDKGKEDKEKTQVFTNALQFEGIIGPSDANEPDKKVKSDYKVAVTLSHNRVGASAEDPKTGFLYMGSARYEEKGGGVDVTMVNVKNAEDTLTLVGTYQSATKMLRITEFGSEERNAMLPLKSDKKIEDTIKTYTVPVDLPVIGNSVLLFRISGQQATVAVIAGQGSSGGSAGLGSYGTLTAYETSGLIGRAGKLTVRIPLDTKEIAKAKSVLELTATITNSGVSNLNSSILTFQNKDGGFDQADQGHLNDTVLPHFIPATLSFKGTDNKYYALKLTAEPVITGTRGVREARETYAMTAQFFQYGNTTASMAEAPTMQSIPVTVRGTFDTANQTFTNKDDPTKTPVKPPVFTFDFPLGIFANTSYADLCNSSDITNHKAVGFKITNWTPITGSGTGAAAVPETVVKGDFEIAWYDAPATAVLTGAIVLGVAGTKLSGPNNDYNTVTGTSLTTTAAKANTLFNIHADGSGEGFKAK